MWDLSIRYLCRLRSDSSVDFDNTSKTTRVRSADSHSYFAAIVSHCFLDELCWISVAVNIPVELKICNSTLKEHPLTLTQYVKNG